jgi:hypothetical protein
MNVHPESYNAFELPATPVTRTVTTLNGTRGKDKGKGKVITALFF